MADIACVDIAKKFKKEILFRQFDFTFLSGRKYAILGANSSGKSTLLKIIGGALAATKGSVTYRSEAPRETLISFCSPEMYLLDDFTVEELFELHFQFKKPKLPVKQQWEESNLTPFLTKKYAELSSGLKNKIKLSLALFSDTPILLLDEPCTNFDDKNSAWYNEMIKRHCQNQLIIVASNQEIEYEFCKEHIDLYEYKNKKK